MTLHRSFSFVIFGLCSTILSSCLCNDNYTLEVPIKIKNVAPEYSIGDTLFFEMIINKKMVYDTSNKEQYYISNFNPHLQVHNIVIGHSPPEDDLDTTNILNFNSKYNYIFYHKPNSYGIRIDEPFDVNDTIMVEIGLILQKPGMHMIYFDSPFEAIGDDFIFSNKCSNSYTDVYIHLTHGNNEYLLSNEHKNVIDLHFEKIALVKDRTAKFYYHVVE